MSRLRGAAAIVAFGRNAQPLRKCRAKPGPAVQSPRDRVGGTPLAAPRAVVEKLRRRLSEYGREDLGDTNFAERLVELMDEIERGFDGDVRRKLLELAEDTFERHLELREHTQRARRDLERLQADQRRLVEILEGLTVRPENEPLH